VSSRGMQAVCYWFWTITALVGAVLNDGVSVT
jgi:hypothetical protein